MSLAACTAQGAVSHGVRRSDDHDQLPLEAVDLQQTTQHGMQDAESARSMESLLHWAIAHSDPDELSDRAAQAAEDQAIQSMVERKQRVRELMDVMDSQPTEAQLMKESIAVIASTEAEPHHLVSVLGALQVLVEPIDNANDLKVMGGIPPLVALLTAHANTSVRAAAAHVIGTAASNNPTFQTHLLEAAPDIFSHMTKLLGSPDSELSAKALYAVAALVRNLDGLRRAFVAAYGVAALQQALASPTTNARAHRKALALLVDLLHLDPEACAQACLEAGVPAAVARFLGSADHDLQEKAVAAVAALLGQGPHRAALLDALLAAGAGQHLALLQEQLMSQLRAIIGADGGDLDDAYIKFLIQQCEDAQRALGLPSHGPTSSDGAPHGTRDGRSRHSEL